MSRSKIFQLKFCIQIRINYIWVFASKSLKLNITISGVGDSVLLVPQPNILPKPHPQRPLHLQRKKSTYTELLTLGSDTKLPCRLHCLQCVQLLVSSP